MARPYLTTFDLRGYRFNFALTPDGSALERRFLFSVSVSLANNRYQVGYFFFFENNSDSSKTLMNSALMKGTLQDEDKAKGSGLTGRYQATDEVTPQGLVPHLTDATLKYHTPTSNHHMLLELHVLGSKSRMLRFPMFSHFNTRPDVIDGSISLVGLEHQGHPPIGLPVKYNII